MNVITVTEAVALTGAEAATIRHWLRQGWIDGARKTGRIWLIPAPAIENFRPPRPGPKSKGKNND